MARTKSVARAVLVWALAAAIAPACYGGQEASGPAAPDLSALAADPARDLALFKVAGENLPTLPLGDSSTLRPGQRVVAITAPEGLGNTVADGLVSAVRELPSGPVVQVTVPLSPGSSGGPIFDLSGRVVAVAAAVLTEGQALNFAIPINAVKPLLAQPGRLTPLAHPGEPADLEGWLREHPAAPGQAGALDLWLQGGDAYLDGRYQEALGHLRAALALDPALYQAHCCLGSSYGELGRYQEALTAFNNAIRLKPDDADAHHNLGVAYGKLGRYQEAIVAYKEAIRLKPDNADAHYNLGVAYGSLGRHQEAIAACQQAIRLKPDYAKAHHNLGVAYGELGRYQEAIAAYQRGIGLKPDLAEAHYGLGFAYGSLGRWQEALEAFQEAIRLKPDYALAHSNLGIAYLVLGDRGAALEEYRILQDLDPSIAERLFRYLYP